MNTRPPSLSRRTASVAQSINAGCAFPTTIALHAPSSIMRSLPLSPHATVRSTSAPNVSRTYSRLCDDEVSRRSVGRSVERRGGVAVEERPAGGEREKKCERKNERARRTRLELPRALGDDVEVLPPAHAARDCLHVQPLLPRRRRDRRRHELDLLVPHPERDLMRRELRDVPYKATSGWRSAFTTPTRSYGDQCIERASSSGRKCASSVPAAATAAAAAAATFSKSHPSSSRDVHASSSIHAYAPARKPRAAAAARATDAGAFGTTTRRYTLVPTAQMSASGVAMTAAFSSMSDANDSSERPVLYTSADPAGTPAPRSAEEEDPFVHVRVNARVASSSPTIVPSRSDTTSTGRAAASSAEDARATTTRGRRGDADGRGRAARGRWRGRRDDDDDDDDARAIATSMSIARVADAVAPDAVADAIARAGLGTRLAARTWTRTTAATRARRGRDRGRPGSGAGCYARQTALLRCCCWHRSFSVVSSEVRTSPRAIPTCTPSP
eukprot:29631-Pelagococcus_subviridis.AAC.1